MRRTCAASGVPFEISAEDRRFYEKMGVPPPQLSPEERQRRRIAFRNFRSLYRRPCDGTGKTTIAMYDVDSPFPVYSHEYWWSDAWDAGGYSRDFDFGRPFFEQYKQLSDVVPRFAVMNVQAENCIFSNMVYSSHNCYLVFGCVCSEDCLYGHIVWDSRNCVDTLYAYRCEWCSHSIDIVDCYGLHYSTECAGCRESYFLHDCKNCKNCFACTNLRNRQYCFYNEQYTKDEYCERV